MNESDLTARDKAASARVRAYLGERLQAYYQSLQQLPVPDDIQELLQRIARDEANVGEHDAAAAPPKPALSNNPC